MKGRLNFLGCYVPYECRTAGERLASMHLQPASFPVHPAYLDGLVYAVEFLPQYHFAATATSTFELFTTALYFIPAS